MYYLTTTAGFEPTRDLHNRFQVCLLDHSDKPTIGSESYRLVTSSLNY